MINTKQFIRLSISIYPATAPDKVWREKQEKRALLFVFYQTPFAKIENFHLKFSNNPDELSKSEFQREFPNKLQDLSWNPASKSFSGQILFCPIFLNIGMKKVHL